MEIVTFISGKGGVGKSTLTCNVAVGLSARGKRVLVIDLDPQNIQRLHLGMDPEEIAGLAREGINDDAVFDSPFGVRFIPFGRLQDGELVEFEQQLRLHPDWVKNGIANLDPGAYDFVLIDTPPGATTYLQQALHAAHRALVVLLADAASFATVARILALVATHTRNNEAFIEQHIVLNQMPLRSKLSHQVRKSLIEHYGSMVVPVSVRRDPGVPQALAFERPVLQYEPTCPASQAIQALADWLIDSSEAS
ncbi:cellulose biosynthesis protein BcsQ [Curvibacter sp. APW13]|uniref:cellulose biosynthesis protein BcsQ n=1 Tax=Curvibacter sp. APW13 TaxID=3077236 RepID=UPI0028DDF746|nr:cellulose biosynthesis protein BcsQ [Curvibacter sp. APW13]MDT8990055.1 cellulose biosynthesis protein BcsQ [Curvibacter sp. APW13]